MYQKKIQIKVFAFHTIATTRVTTITVTITPSSHFPSSTASAVVVQASTVVNRTPPPRAAVRVQPSPVYRLNQCKEKVQMDSSQSAAVGGNGGNGTLISQANDAAASAAGVDDSMQKLNQVSNSIQKTLGLIHQLYLTVSTFNAAFQMPLLQRINGLVAELDNMVKLAEKCNIQIPMEVVNLIDDGKNPDEFTRDVLNNCIAKNQIAKGKTDALKILRKNLLEELEQNFPAEVETFRESRAASAAEMKRLAQAQSVLPNGDVRIKSEH